MKFPIKKYYNFNSYKEDYYKELKISFELIDFKSHIARKNKNKNINGGLYFLKF